MICKAKIKFLILLFFLLLLQLEVEAKRVGASSYKDFVLNNKSGTTFIVSTTIDFEGRSISLASGVDVVFKNNGSIYNGSIQLNGESTIINGRLFVDDSYEINDVLILKGCNNRLIRCVIDGRRGKVRFGISAFNAIKTKIKSCVINNIGCGVDNTAGIRLDGDCSNSLVKDCKIFNVEAAINASGIVINQNVKEKKYSKNINLIGCSISNVIPEADGDGIKILQNHLPAYHLIRDCSFYNCAKRAIKIQGLGVKCLDNYVSGGCSESIIDYQNGDCFINGLNAENIDYVYAAIYIQGSEGPVKIKSVNVNANDTEKPYVRGIKIKKASWDIDKPMSYINISNCSLSNFYMTISLEGFSRVESLVLRNCSLYSVDSPIYINTSLGEISIVDVEDYQLKEKRNSIVFSKINECSIVSLLINEHNNNKGCD